MLGVPEFDSATEAARGREGLGRAVHSRCIRRLAQRHDSLPGSSLRLSSSGRSASGHPLRATFGFCRTISFRFGSFRFLGFRLVSLPVRTASWRWRFGAFRFWENRLVLVRVRVGSCSADLLQVPVHAGSGSKRFFSVLALFGSYGFRSVSVRFLSFVSVPMSF